MSRLIDDVILNEAIPSSQLAWQSAGEDQVDFMRRVYDINLTRSTARGTFIADIPDSELSVIEDGHQAKKEAAAACRKLLASVRQEIQTAAVNVEVGIVSGYRSATHQFELWQSYFPGYYNDTADHRATLPGGPHGEDAANYLALYIRGKIATPGFSNHQNGIAVDLLNKENGTTLRNKTRQSDLAKWKESWFWGWLGNHANSFGFFQNTAIKEPWHWEYRGRKTSSITEVVSTESLSVPSEDFSAILLKSMDLYSRGYITLGVLSSIFAGERDQNNLTDQIFYFRHPERFRINAPIQTTEPNYKQLRTEWIEIKTKIIAPIFQRERALERYGETYVSGNINRFREAQLPKEHHEEESESQAREEHDDAKGRLEWFYRTRISGSTSGQTQAEYAVASAQVRQMSHERNELAEMENLFGIESSPGGPGTNNWTPLGPSVIHNGQASNTPPVSGRITSLAVNANGDRLYIGTGNGGVWYSGDRGNNWEPWLGFNPTSRADFSSGNESDSLSVGGIAVIFGTSKTKDEIYVGTGESYASLGSSAYFGVGIKHYLNGNLTLEDTNQRLPKNQLAGKGIYKIVIDPAFPSRPFAATTIGLFRRNTSGVWEKITATFAKPDKPVSDFVIAGTGASRKYYVAFDSDKVYEGDSGLTTWTALPGPALRIALAASSTNASFVYALDQNNKLYKLDGGTFRVVTGVPAIFNGSQGWYDIILAVEPGHDDVVYMAGDWVSAPGTYDLSLYKGTIGGTSPSFTFSGSFIGKSIHPDGHAIAFSKDTAGTTQVWIGNDGGLFYSDTPAVNGSFKPRNIGISSVQLNYIAQWNQTDTVVFAGAQDNGTLRFWGDQVWHEDPQGDGGGVAVDGNNEYNIMRQYVRASLRRSSDGGQSWTPVNLPISTAATYNENAATSFYGPIAAFSSGAGTLAAFGTDRLWLSTDWGSTWRTLPNNNVSDRIGQIIAVKIASATRIFAATSRSVFRYDLTLGVSPTWNRIALPNPTGLPAGYIISSLDVDNAATGSFYISLGGVGRFERCYYYDGTAWHAAGPPVGTLNIPCHAMVVDQKAPRNIYLGSDVGVWKGVRGANAWTLTWEHYSPGLPEAAITDLIIHQKARLLRCATHGRGVWEIAIDETRGASVDIYLRANPADSGRMKGGSRFPWIKTANDPTRVPTSANLTVTLAMSPDIKVRRASLAPITTRVTYFDFGYNLGDQSRNPNWQRGDLTGKNQVFIQTHNRGLDIIRGSNIRIVLLMADASSGSTPDLPAGFTSHINSGDTDPRWLSGSVWKFADSAHPTKILSSNLNVRTPQVAQFDVLFSDLTGLTATSKVALLAFITTIDTTDQLSGTNTKVEDLIMADKHVAQRYVVFS